MLKLFSDLIPCQCKHCDHPRKSVASRVYGCIPNEILPHFFVKVNTKIISVSMKINLVEMYEDSYKGKKKSHSLV